MLYQIPFKYYIIQGLLNMSIRKVFRQISIHIKHFSCNFVHVYGFSCNFVHVYGFENKAQLALGEKEFQKCTFLIFHVQSTKICQLGNEILFNKKLLRILRNTTSPFCQKNSPAFFSFLSTLTPITSPHYTLPFTLLPLPTSL